MSEGGESNWGTGFFLGFLLGVFVCLGAGGTFIAVQQQRMQAEAEMARMRAHEAALRAREAAEAAEAQARREKALNDALRAAKEKGTTQKKE